MPHPSTSLLCRLPLAGLALIVVAACSAPPTATPTYTATPRPTDTPTPSPTPTATATPTPSPSPTPTSTPTSTPTPRPTETPTPESEPPLGTFVPSDCSVPPHSASEIKGRRLVAYYGSPVSGRMGVLGAYDLQTMLEHLRAEAAAYQALDPCLQVVIVFEMVVTVADGFPGEDGDYNHRLAPETLRQWLDIAAREGAWVVLDVQPGRSPIETELAVIEPYLREPNVHLAIDPEWAVGPEQIPGVHSGRVDGETINWIQTWLSQIAQDTGEQKILVIHQFRDDVITNKHLVQDYPLIDMVWHADGWGSHTAKVADYNQYREEAGFENGGFKLFYQEDYYPIMTPQQVMSLYPPPAFISYQ
jgi:hypothetical protein